jgi:four helix bundle protein
MAFKFEKLQVWQKAMDLADALDTIARNFPSYEQFNISIQMRRAADSIALNIAEGSTASSNAEQARFVGIAIRSCNEVVCCWHKAIRRNYVDPSLFRELYQRLEELAKQLQALRNRLNGH